jgi:NTE family protein
VLRGLVDLGLFGECLPFDILVGSSAGSINAAALAAFADRFPEAVRSLQDAWSGLRPQQVFRTDLRSLSGIGARWVRDLSFGGVFGHVTPKALLDTAPMRELIARWIPFARIDASLARGALRALAVLATDLYTSHGVVFVHGSADVGLWHRSWHRIERARIGVEHLMASSAIPIFFPSVEIDGRHFGDGCIRNTSPLSPAIHLGADRIVALGVRGPDQGTLRLEAKGRPPPTVAQISGVLLDAVMLDAIEADVEHSERVNTSVLASGAGSRGPFRWIDVLWLRPSRAVGEMAAQMFHRIPRVVRYLMRGLGTEESTTELASYLLFDGTFCSHLIDLGRADVAARAEEIRAFFSSASRRSGGRLMARRRGG